MGWDQKVIQLVLGQGGRVFSKTAGRIAFKLFCRTENPKKPSKSEAAAIERAAPLMAEARHHFLKTANGQIAVHQFKTRTTGSRKGNALVIHGWRSRTDFMTGIIACLTEDGWDVFGLDLPGHGQSSGRSLNVKLGVEAVHAAAMWFGPFDLVVGHSFGGVIGLNAAIGGIKGFEPLQTNRLVMISSPNSVPELFSDVGRYFGLRNKAQRAMEDCVEKLAGFPLASFVASDGLKKFNGQALIIHSQDDKEVAFSNATTMSGAGPHVRLAAFDKLGHRRIISDPNVCLTLQQFAALSEANPTFSTNQN